jgi:hypothetical protein
MNDVRERDKGLKRKEGKKQFVSSKACIISLQDMVLNL